MGSTRIRIPLSDVVCAREGCSKLCTVIAVQGESPAYCTRACFEGIPEAVCPVCGDEYTRGRNGGQIYCSDPCAREGYRIRSKGGTFPFAPPADEDEPSEADLVGAA